MLRQRFITAFIGLPLIIAAIWFGTPWFTLLIAAVAIQGILEFYRTTSNSGTQPITYFGATCVLFIIISPHCPYTMTTPILITFVIVISLVWLLFRTHKEQAFSNWAWTIAGIFYIGWLFSYWIDLRILENGREWVFWSMFTIFASDTSAFFCGRTWGKHPLAPAISPGKTWAGAIGGITASIIISIALGTALSLPISYWQMALMGSIISIFAQLGDLVESLFKRNTGIKDAGKILPGHGGILDRADSIIFTGFLVYYFVKLVN